MNLASYVETLRHELAVAAEAGGEEARVLADRLTGPLESAARLVLLEALSAAANEITRDLAPGSVDVRLRGRDPEFVVTSPTVAQASGGQDMGGQETAPRGSVIPTGDEDGSTSRTTLRLPESLKVRMETAAGGEGLSVNAWLVRAVAAALDTGDRDRRANRSGGQRYTGWAQ